MNKKVLVMSGGGAVGAHSVGVLKALTEEGKSWDVVVGVSVGAINCLQLAQFPKNEHKQAVLELEKLWLEDIKGNSSIYKPWAPWIFNYFASLFKGSVYNTKPLLSILEKRFNKEKFYSSGVDLKVGTVGLKTGMYKSVPKNEENILQWILASASMPVLFQPVEIAGDKWVDGGVRNITPLSDVVDLNPTEIDIVITNPLKNYKFSFSKFNSSVDVAARTLELMVNEILITDLLYLQFEKIHNVKVNVYQPSKILEYDAFDFNPVHIKNSIELGYKETKEKLLK